MSIREQSRLQDLRIAKLIRLLQTASNPTLLWEMSSTFDVDGENFSDRFGEEFGFPPISLTSISGSVVDEIQTYTSREIPSKIVKVTQMTRDLVDKGNKVIIWSTFIHNMDVLQREMLKELDPIVINGTVPKDGDSETRDHLLNRFKNENSMVLIASPASLAESVSLHKNLKGENVCNHAIYLDRNFNGAQYMQSMDRIHRIGMDESAKVEYHLIIAENTIDEVIHRRLNEKQDEMLRALNDDMLNDLNMDPTPTRVETEDLDADYRAVVEHLRHTCGR